MKLASLTILVLLMSYLGLDAKIKGSDDYCIRKNNTIVTLGYGAPSIVRSYLKYKTTREQISVAGSGPYIFKTEFMLTKRIGVGVNAAYSQSRVYWYDTGYDTVQLLYRKFEFGIKAYELSGTVRFNYHYIKSPKLDAYAGAGAGYGLFNMASYTLAHTTNFSVRYEIPKPYSLEATTGVRYFPLKNLGFYTEVGVGKSWILFRKYFLPEALIQAGLVFKF